MCRFFSWKVDGDWHGQFFPKVGTLGNGPEAIWFNQHVSSSIKSYQYHHRKIGGVPGELLVESLKLDVCQPLVNLLTLTLVTLGQH